MFISDSHLPQLLTPDDYTSPAQLRRELERLFLPGWHLVGTFSDLPRDGDSLTIELFGCPLIVRRTGGEYRTCLNVGPHRFSRIKPFRTETCGQLIFVTLADEGPSLAESLGPGYEVGRTVCSEDRRLAATLDYEIPANWKCKCENSLESYHVDMVHPTTFKRTPEAEECFHELQPGWTTYATHQQPQSKLDRLLDRLVHRLARQEPDPEYKHYHYYPHVMFGKMRLFSWIELTLPLAPDRTRVIGKFFCHGGRNGSLRSRVLTRLLARWQKKFFTKLALEDSGVLTEVQRGLSSKRQPSKGLISVREERCWHFQKYIREATRQDALEPEQREGTYTRTASERMTNVE